jgi:septum formation protein
MPAELILASTSPRRSQLLSQAGFTYRILATDVAEAHDPQLTCQQLTEANALLKAKPISTAQPSAYVIGADTLVYHRSTPLGKPRNMEEARQMLRTLSGHTHQVCTGVAIIHQASQHQQTFSVITHVTFHTLTEDIISTYHSLVPVLDKAGGYAIQDHGHLIVSQTQGSLSNVIGLPVEELSQRLQALGFHPQTAA